MHTDAEHSGEWVLFTKGAPDVLLTRCSHELVGEASEPLSDARRAHVLRTNEDLAGRALRTLGIAFRTLPASDGAVEDIDERAEHELVFAGVDRHDRPTPR